MDRKKKEKVERRLTRTEKIAMKPRSKWLQEAQAAINSYVRSRDYGDVCISCGNKMNWNMVGGAVDSSHYRSTGSSPHMRFNIFNVHAGCVKCNRFLSGNITDYRIRLIKKIGEKKVLEIENDNTARNYSIEYLKRIKKIFNRKARMYRKRLQP